MVSSFISWCLPVETCIFVNNSSLARKKPRYLFASFRIYQSEWHCNRKVGTIFMSSHGLILKKFFGGNSVSILQCSREIGDVESAIFDALKSAASRISSLNVKVWFGSETGHVVELKKKQFQCQKTWNNWCIRSTDVLVKCFMALDPSKSFFKNLLKDLYSKRLEYINLVF